MDVDTLRQVALAAQMVLLVISGWLFFRAGRTYRHATDMYLRAAAMLRKDPPPRAPEGVRAEYADGEIYEDLPVMFIGWDPDGVARYEVVLPRDVSVDRPVAIGARLLPAGTAIGFAMSALE